MSSDAPRTPRYHHLDALRGIAMLLGVVLHATMSLVEPQVLRWSSFDSQSHIAFSWIAVYLHAFRMQLFFIMAGFFGRLLLLRIGEAAFVRHRLQRVALPFAVALVTIVPLTFLAHMFGIQAMDQQVLLDKFVSYGPQWELVWTWYNLTATELFTTGALLERFRLFHLWFLEYLLLMYAVWLGLRRVGPVASLGETAARWTHKALASWWGPLLLAGLLLPMLLTMSEVEPTPKHPPHPPTWLYYTTFFAVGWAMHAKPSSLEDAARGWPWKLALSVGVLLPGVMVLREAIAGPAAPGSPEDRLAFASVYALLTVYATLGTMGLFSKIFATDRPWLRYLADAAYWIYLVHLPVVKVLHAVVADWPMNGWLKLVGVTVLTSAFCVGTYAAFVRHTFIGRVLHGERPRPEPGPDTTAGLLPMVPVVAGTLIAFEVLTHRQLLLVSDTLSALTAIPVAVMGLGLGGLLAARRLDDPRAPESHAWTYVGTLVTVLLALPLLGDWLPLLSPVLMVPYLYGGALLSRAFARLPTSQVYPLDLAAAAGGVLLVAFGLPHLAEEGLQVLLVALALLAPACLARAPWRRSAALVGAALVAILAVVQGVAQPYNLARDSGQYLPTRAEARGVAAGARYDKVFSALRHNDNLVWERSLSAVPGRVDLVRQLREDGTTEYVRVYENGNSIDVLSTRPVDAYAWDPRVPEPLLPDDPAFFIIGTAGEGILKAARALDGPVAGTEIDTALLELARGVAAPDCDHCYDDVEVIADEGRAALTRDDRRYDVITLLNTHVSKGVVEHRAGDAEFIHTRQAVQLMLRRLTEGGAIVWEHPQHSGGNGRVAIRQLATTFAALGQLDVEDPWRHAVAWRWAGYDQVLVSRAPLTRKQLDDFERWLIYGRYAASGPAPKTELLWTPHRPDEGDGPIARWLTAVATGADLPAGQRPAALVVTDDHPFPFDLPAGRSRLNEALGLVAGLGSLALLVLLVGVRRAATGPWARHAGAAALSGFGYLYVEAALLHELPLLVGNPAIAVTVVLVTMLLASGLGGALSARLPRGAQRAALLAIPVAIVGLSVVLSAGARTVLTLAPTPRLFVAAAIVAVPAALMGLPLSIAVTRARDQAGEAQGALLFAANGAAGAPGVLAALTAGVALGLPQAWWIGVACYVAVAALLW